MSIESELTIQTGFPLQPRTFRLPLYLEWLLLGVVLLMQLHPRRWVRLYHDPTEISLIAISLSLLLGFTLLGLRLPINRLGPKLAYILTGFGFIVIAAVMMRGYFRLEAYPLLLLVNLIRCCLIFQQTGRIMMALMTFSVYLVLRVLQPLRLPPDLFQGPRPFRPSLGTEELNTMLMTATLHSIILFGLALGFLMLLINAWLSERDSRSQLAWANQQLKAYALKIEAQATLQERNRIAREIHDSLGHSLSAQTIQLNNALLYLDSNQTKTRQFLTESQRLGLNALQDIRQSIQALRSNPLQGQSLESAVTQLVHEFERTTGLSTSCQIELARHLSRELEAAVYRIIQEGLTNAQRHSEALSIKIQLQSTAKLLYVLVEDDGKGFDTDLNTTGFGLQGIRERVEALSGQFYLQSSPGSGCRFTIYIPLLPL